jgi:hypothetical protein
VSSPHMRILVAVALLLPACGDDGSSSYGTFQACFDDLDQSQSRRVSILTCCLDHDIGGAMEVCGTSATTCASYVTVNLEATSASSTEIMDACEDYAMMRGM